MLLSVIDAGITHYAFHLSTFQSTHTHCWRLSTSCGQSWLTAYAKSWR